MIEIEHLNKTYPSPTGDIHALRSVGAVYMASP